MGAIAAVTSKFGGDAGKPVLDMMEKLTHRGKDSYGVATPNGKIIAKSFSDLESMLGKVSLAAGYNQMMIFPRDIPQPFSAEDHSIIFEGRLYPASKSPDVKRVSKIIGEEASVRKLTQLVRFTDGAYSLAVIKNRGLMFARDPLGLSPLYYGECGEFFAAASEKKALWSIGVENPKSFPPGFVATLTKLGFSFHKAEVISQPKPAKIGSEVAVRNLRSLLLRSVKQRTRDVKEVAVAFSGGVDSSLLAQFARMAGLDIRLIVVGVKGRSKTEEAREAAEALELPVTVRDYTINDVGEALRKVLWHIEDANPLKVELAIPIYWAAGQAKYEGFKVLLAGHGCDELFGGYHAFLERYQEGGVEAVRKAILESVVGAYELNYQRDEQAASPQGVELRLPYVDRSFIKYSLSIPVEFKIEGPADPLRKRILRKLGESVGLPESIANKPKKAIQYSTGVSWTLRRLAGSHGMKLNIYLSKLFGEMNLKRFQ